MTNKSCGNCKYCMKMVPVREGAEPLWICNKLMVDDEYDPYDVTPPYDEACEHWAEGGDNQ